MKETTINKPVFFSGENPGMTLLNPDSGQPTAIASYWYCTDSPNGLGHALIIYVPSVIESAPGLTPGGIFTDNILLAEILAGNLTQYFPEFANVPVTSLPYIDAECGHSYDGERYQVICESSDTVINLEWSTILDRKQINWPGFKTGDRYFDLSTVICPCKTGIIKINDCTLNGSVKVAESDSGSISSTAFLAFAESWVGPFEIESGNN